MTCSASSGSSDQQVLLGSGPGSATIKLAAFIPYEWVGNPFNWFRVFGGDGRSFAYVGSSRAQTVLDVLNPAVNDGDLLSGPYHDTGLTTEYDIATSLTAPPPFGQLRQEARDDWTWDDTLKTRWAFAGTSDLDCSDIQRLGPDPATESSAHVFTCEGAVSNPLVAASPDIDWRITLTLRYGQNRVRYTVSGCVDPFPAFEVYVNGSAVVLSGDSGNVDDLFYYCSKAINESGELQ